MITAVLLRKGDRFTGYKASGHSGYAEEGSDIVCAAVSVLGCTCVNSLERLLGVRVIMKADKDGLLAFDLPEVPGEKESGVQLLMAALGEGLSDLQEACPKYVKFNIKERRKTP